MAKLTTEDRVFLRQLMVDRFNLDELKTLTFELGVDYEMIPHRTKAEFIQELISFYERRENVRCLIEKVMQARPSDELVALVARIGSCSPRQKVQIILPELKLANLNKEKVLAGIAQAVGMAPEDIMLIGAAAGSVLLLVSLPAPAADRLVTLAPGQIAGYEVSAVTNFSELTAVEQFTWMTTVLEAWSGRAAFLIPGFTGPWLLRLLVWLGAGFLVLLLARSAIPRLAVTNRCADPIERRYSVPVLGEVHIFIPPGETKNYPISPGQYELIYDENGEVRARLPLVGEIGPYFANELPVLFQGEPIRAGEERTESVGLFDDFELVLCP